jgi:hypothetical protein
MRTLVLALTAACGASAQAQLWYLENFEAGSNTAAWTFDAPGQSLDPAGGFAYCCAYLRSGVVSTPLPAAHTGVPGTPFTGNYRAAEITRLAAAFIVRQAELPFSTQVPAVMLVSFNGTPADPSDDWGAFRLAGSTLAPLNTWRMLSFNIPSAQTSLPAGWTILRLGPNAPLTPDWNTLVQGVDRLTLAFGDPSAVYPPQIWDVGIDYIFITNQRNCYPNCDNSTASPCLNVVDFVCFLNRFAEASPYANCDGSTNLPVHNVLDFGCFLMNYAAGCSGC